jgi:hypothetical protein
LETAFVPWCRIVGEVFSDHGSTDLSRPATSDGHRKLTRAGRTSDGPRRHMRGQSHGRERSLSIHNTNITRNRSNIGTRQKYNHSSDTEQSGGKSNGVVRLFRRLSAYSPYKSAHIGTSGSGSTTAPGTRSTNRSASYPPLSRRSHAREHENRHSTRHSSSHPRSSRHENHRHHHHRGDTHHDQHRSSRRAGRTRHRRAIISSAKDLAIQPTQRIMRYVLLYRGD